MVYVPRKDLRGKNPTGRESRVEYWKSKCIEELLFGDVEEMYNGSYTSMKCSQAFPSGRRCPSQDAQDLLVSLELGFVRGCQSDRSFHDIVGDFTQGLQL
jgi:hypothetical protein